MSTPIRELEAWAAWCAEADRLGLHRGERLDFDSVLVGISVPIRPAELDAILVERTRIARLQRPAYRIDGLTITADPVGVVNNLAAVVAELRARLKDAHRLAVLDDIDRQIAEGRTEVAAAKAWARGSSVRTIRRRRDETGQNRRPLSGGRPKTRVTIDPGRASPSRARLANPAKTERVA